MENTANPKNHFWFLIPLFGILIFAFLYFIATNFYPGGSNFNRSTVGFDWLNNYWCDLTGEYAKNGEINRARPIAITAMVILCSALTLFWWNITLLLNNSRLNQIIRYSGVTSMIIAVFLFTSYHDTVINVAGAFGIVAIIAIFIGLYKNNLLQLFNYGVFCLALMIFNYFIYQTGIFLLLLPVIQKATFVLFLIWICLMNIYLYKKIISS